MSKIETGRYSDLLRRFLALKGVQEVAGELSPEISAVFILEDDRPDWSFLKAERLVGVGHFAASGATAGPTFRLRNPAGSGVLATIKIIEGSVGPGDTLEIRLNAQNLDLGGGIRNTSVRDTRDGFLIGIVKSSCIFSFNTTVAPVGTTIYSMAAPTDEPRSYKEPLILSPGHSVDFGSLAVQAVTLNCWMSWIERALAPLEAS